jgi:hypothetical protein
MGLLMLMLLLVSVAWRVRITATTRCSRWNCPPMVVRLVPRYEGTATAAGPQAAQQGTLIADDAAGV